MHLAVLDYYLFVSINTFFTDVMLYLIYSESVRYSGTALRYVSAFALFCLAFCFTYWTVGKFEGYGLIKSNSGSEK